MMQRRRALRRFYSISIALAVATTLAANANAQVAPATDIHVYVSLSDSTSRYEPVPGHRLIFYRSARDSVVAMTDASGSTTAYATPGVYRVVSATPVDWHGKRYSWSVPLTVTGTTALVDLNAQNATVNGIAPMAAVSTTMRVPVDALGSGSPAATSVGGFERKSTTTAFVLGFLVPGVGHIYADEVGTGLLLLVVTGVAASKIYTGNIDCGTSVCQAEISQPALGVALAGWLYGMVDGVSAVHRYNKKHSLDALVMPGANGSTKLGLAMRF